MKLKPSTTRQLSIAVGLLSFAAFIVQGLGDTWGFQAIAKIWSGRYARLFHRR